MINGYEGEPYLRFTRDGVLRNARSPATWLNEDRFAEVDVPPEADAKAPPRWERVEDETSYSWHDHRIHWMSPIPPPRIKAAPDREHHVFDWRVPGELAGRPFAISGSLDYAPPPGEDPSWALIGGGGAPDARPLV